MYGKEKARTENYEIEFSRKCLFILKLNTFTTITSNLSEVAIMVVDIFDNNSFRTNDSVSVLMIALTVESKSIATTKWCKRVTIFDICSNWASQTR